MRSRRIVAIAVVILVAAGAWYLLKGCKGQAVPIETAQAERTDLEASFTAEGVVEARTYDVSSEIPGRVDRFLVREGDPVTVGAIVCVLSGEDLDASLTVARAAVRSGSASVTEASRAYEAALQQFNGRIAVADARLKEAQAALQRVESGPTQEQIEQARINVEKLEIAVADAELHLQRVEMLHEAGALPKSELDAARTRLSQANADLRQAKSVLRDIEGSPTPEELRQAKAAVESARTEKAVAAQSDGEVDVARVRVQVARSRFSEAQAELARLEAQRAKLTIRAPSSGVVSRVVGEAGKIVGPGAPLVTIASRDDLRVEAEITSEDVGAIEAGMRVVILSPAHPGVEILGVVEHLSARGEPKPESSIRTRIVRARITPIDGAELLTVGTDVDVEGSRTLKSILVVPSDALVISGSRVGVYVVKGGVARWVEVRTGYSDSAVTEVVSGVSEGDAVVISGKDQISDGAAVVLAE